MAELEVFSSPVERELVLAGVLAAAFGGGDPEARSEPELAARIGRYSILRKLGEGGMGVVLLGYDDQLHREAAIKLIRASRSGPEAKQRLLREAQGLARLSHPNVVQVYEGGIHDGNAYIAMEYVSGQTLTSWLAEPRSHDEILAVFRAAGLGLAAAHAAGLVHRDFKPDNVMLTEGGEVKVMDFGLARALAGDAEPDADPREALPTPAPEALDQTGAARLSQALTRTGTLLGTPAYMSPEQFATGEFDARSDQFSYCIALWEALYGARPFRGRNIVELSAAVSSGRIELPSELELRPPARIERILRRGLSVDPDARWSSMGALLEALDHDPAPRARRLAVAGLAVLGLGAVAIVSPYLAAPPPPQLAAGPVCPDARARLEPWQAEQRRAVAAKLEQVGGVHGQRLSAQVLGAIDAYAEDWAAAHRDACEATHVRQEQSAELLDARMGCLDERSRELAAIVELVTTTDSFEPSKVTRAISKLGPVEICSNRDYLAAQVPLPTDPARAAEVEELLARNVELEAKAELGYADLEPELEQLLVQAEALDHEPLRAELLSTLGSIQASAGPAELAQATLEQALLAALRSGQDRLAAMIATELAYVVGYRLHEVEEGVRYAALAAAWQDKIDAPQIDRVRRTISEVLALTHDDSPEARARVDAGVESILSTLDVRYVGGQVEGVEELDVSAGFAASIALNVMAVKAYRAGQLREARALMIEVAELRRRLLTPDNPQVQLMELNLSALAVSLGDLVEAESRLRSVYDDVRARGDGQVNHLAILHINLTEVHNLRLELLGPSERAAAEEVFAQAVADLEPILDHPGVDAHRFHYNRARFRRLIGELDAAAASLDAAAEQLPEGAEITRERVDLELERSALALVRGEPDVALDLVELAARAVEELDGDTELLRAMIDHHRGEALAALGHEQDALAALREALDRFDAFAAKGSIWAIPTCDRLAELDRDHAAEYRRRATELRARL